MELQHLAEVSRNEAIVFGHRLRSHSEHGATSISTIRSPNSRFRTRHTRVIAAKRQPRVAFWPSKKEGIAEVRHSSCYDQLPLTPFRRLMLSFTLGNGRIRHNWRSEISIILSENDLVRFKRLAHTF